MRKSNKRKGLACLVGVALTMGFAAVGVISGAAGAAQPLRRLPAPKHLTSEDVAGFKGRMGRHGNTMSSLVRAVVLLDRPTIRTLAGRISDEEVVARIGAPADATRHFPLPQDFFDQQDILRSSAQALAVAAAVEGDDKLLADHFATLARTCVTCHSVYLRHDPSFRPAGAKTTPTPSPAQE